jgi:hypothetical protein
MLKNSQTWTWVVPKGPAMQNEAATPLGKAQTTSQNIWDPIIQHPEPQTPTCKMELLSLFLCVKGLLEDSVKSPSKCW